MSRLDSTRSVKGRMASSLEMARDSSSRDRAYAIEAAPLDENQIIPSPQRMSRTPLPSPTYATHAGIVLSHTPRTGETIPMPRPTTIEAIAAA